MFDHGFFLQLTDGDKEDIMDLNIMKSVRNPYSMSPEELSEFLNVPLSWVYARSRERGPGAIPRRKLGRYVRFDLKEVESWIDKQQKA